MQGNADQQAKVEAYRKAGEAKAKAYQNKKEPTIQSNMGGKPTEEDAQYAKILNVVRGIPYVGEMLYQIVAQSHQYDLLPTGKLSSIIGELSALSVANESKRQKALNAIDILRASFPPQTSALIDEARGRLQRIARARESQVNSDYANKEIERSKKLSTATMMYDQANRYNEANWTDKALMTQAGTIDPNSFEQKVSELEEK